METVVERDGKLFRGLATTEVIRETDCCVLGGIWISGDAVAMSAGKTAGLVKFKREIRVKSDGWRYLDKNEPITEVDQEHICGRWVYAHKGDFGRLTILSDYWLRRFEVRGDNNEFMKNIAADFMLSEMKDDKPGSYALASQQQGGRFGEAAERRLQRAHHPIGVIKEILSGDEATVLIGNPERQFQTEPIETNAEQLARFEKENAGLGFRDLKPGSIMCGCGWHTVDPSEDIYAQHRKYLKWASGLTPPRSIELLSSIDDPDMRPGQSVHNEAGFDVQHEDFVC